MADATRWLIACACLALLSCRGDDAQHEARGERAAADEPATQPTRSAEPALPGIDRPDAALTAKLRAAAAGFLAKRAPRSRHLREDGSPRYVNRLALETSPYLLQHAFNPVNFRPWGDEAFELARRLDRPVLLSIGYSTCHWCHVMERESFDDEEIAAYLNAHYVVIKVDREERPDLDDVYMAAVNLLTGRGGWPMTVLLTPDREPFFGGTYFPARDGDRGSHKGFLTILREMKQRFESERETVVAQAAHLSRRVAQLARPQRPGDVAGPDALVRGVEGLARAFDPTHGGFGRAPKFPQPSRLELLARYHRRTGDALALRMLVETLDHMAQGGIHDHVGGGFHRYAVDAAWLVPHFEKMLYGNAQLALLYTHVHQLTGEARFRGVACEILDYVAREMTHGEGGFHSATDADSDSPGGHEQEGYFFTWTPGELSAALGAEELRAVSAYYAVTPDGNFDGRNILHTPRAIDVVAAELGVPAAALGARLEAARARLYDARRARPPPLRDDKIITAWNALMISAFAQAGFAFGRDDYLQRARAAAEFLLRRLRTADGRLRRTYLEGRARHNAYLDDHAFLVAALLDLFGTSGEPRWLAEARGLQALQDAHFADGDQGGYFATSDDHEALLARDKPAQDGALPSGNAVAIDNLLRLAELTGDMTHRQRAERALSTFAAELSGGQRAPPRMLAALERYLDTPLEVFIVHPPGASPGGLLETLRGRYLPNAVVAVVPEDRVAALAAQLPLVGGKAPLRGRPTAFVCERGRCELPTHDAKTFARQLAARAPLLADGKPAPLSLP